MPICSKCGTGFEANLSNCPKCGTKVPGKSFSASSSANKNFVWFLITVLLLGVLLTTAVNSRGLFFAILSLVLIGLYIWSIIWSYKDAEARNKPGLMVALLVAFMMWPLGLIIWIVFRP